MDQGVKHGLDTHYRYIGIPSRELMSARDKPRQVVAAGESVVLQAAGTIQPLRCVAFINVNPMLTAAGVVNYSWIVEEDEYSELRIRFTPDAKFNLGELYESAWLVRVYAQE